MFAEAIEDGISLIGSDCFRDYLIDHPEVAQEYADLKLRLAATFRHDREAYTAGKGEFIARVMEEAKRRYGSGAITH